MTDFTKLGVPDVKSLVELNAKQEELRKLETMLAATSDVYEKKFLESEIAKRSHELKTLGYKLGRKEADERRYLTVPHPKLKLKLPYTDRVPMRDRYPEQLDAWENVKDDFVYEVDILDVERWAKEALDSKVHVYTFLTALGVVGALCAVLAVMAFSALQRQVSLLASKVDQLSRTAVLSPRTKN